MDRPRWYHVFYLPRHLAVNIGFTHEGTLFGIPIYMTPAEPNEGDEWDYWTCPKVPILRFVLDALEFLAQCFVMMRFHLSGEDAEITMPFVLGARIDG